MSVAEAADEAFMREAIALAEQGLYSTSPNPAVGCVLVKDGAVIGRGFHRQAGAPHAEVEALRAASRPVAGATAYVSLEPCNHHGRTPPCTEALITAGIVRVVYATGDPNPRVAGSGAARLRAAGIAVEGGVAAGAAAHLNRGFFLRMTAGRPRVRLKMAMSLDARAALADGQSQWITGPEARADVQRLRAGSCAVLSGSGTVLTDDPALNVRDPALATAGRQPRRVILDRRLRTPPTAQLLRLAGETRVVCAAEALDTPAAAALIAAGAVVDAWPAAAPDAALPELLRYLGRLEINELLVEAGPTLAAAFLDHGLVDELVLYVAPQLLGREARPALAVPSPAMLGEARRYRLVESSVIGADLRIVLQPGAAAGAPDLRGDSPCSPVS